MRSDRPLKPANLEAPGLSWRPNKNSWVAYWGCRSDIVKRGYTLKTRRLWPPSERNYLTEPSAEQWLTISAVCQTLQREMLTWANGGTLNTGPVIFDDTVRSLIDIYRSDADSPYQEVRHKTQDGYDYLCDVLRASAFAEARVSLLTFRDFMRVYEAARAPKKAGGKERISFAHHIMTMVRSIFAFGSLLRLPHCKDLKEILSEMEFQAPKRGDKVVTTEQAQALIVQAHESGLQSIAFAQALQTSLMVRQDDVIGEYVPLTEPGVTDVTWRGEKWLHGFRFEELDENFVLTHRVSKSIRGKRGVSNLESGKYKTWNLLNYPMVVAELRWLARVSGGYPLTRDLLPASGPMIVSERSGRPWQAATFSVNWRTLATAAGIPLDVKNMNSRAGASTHAEKLGIPPEQIRQALGQSKIDTTRIYLRAETEITDNIAILRFPKPTGNDMGND